MSLSYSKVGAAYKKTQTQSVVEVADPHAVVLAMLDELLKAMRAFANNADLKAGGDREVKSKSFARSLTIIYALQSSLDFEKGGDIANNLFQLYEYARHHRHHKADTKPQNNRLQKLLHNVFRLPHHEM